MRSYVCMVGQLILVVHLPTLCKPFHTRSHKPPPQYQFAKTFIFPSLHQIMLWVTYKSQFWTTKNGWLLKEGFHEMLDVYEAIESHAYGESTALKYRFTMTMPFSTASSWRHLFSTWYSLFSSPSLLSLIDCHSRTPNSVSLLGSVQCRPMLLHLPTSCLFKDRDWHCIPMPSDVSKTIMAPTCTWFIQCVDFPSTIS